MINDQHNTNILGVEIYELPSSSNLQQSVAHSYRIDNFDDTTLM